MVTDKKYIPQFPLSSTYLLLFPTLRIAMNFILSKHLLACFTWDAKKILCFLFPSPKAPPSPLSGVRGSSPAANLSLPQPFSSPETPSPYQLIRERGGGASSWVNPIRHLIVCPRGSFMNGSVSLPPSQPSSTSSSWQPKHSMRMSGNMRYWHSFALWNQAVFWTWSLTKGCPDITKGGKICGDNISLQNWLQNFNIFAAKKFNLKILE